MAKRASELGSLPLVNPVVDSIELMKKMWGFAGLPGLPSPGDLATKAMRIPQQLPSMMAPTLDVDEIDKRIGDLRAVEQWLELNASMLRTTIQSLEVQRATIATLKGISGAMMAPILGKPTATKKEPPEVTLGLAAMKAEESAAAMNATPSANASGKSAKRAGEPVVPGAAMAAAALNPAAWWSALQDQFMRITAGAVEAVPKPAAKSTARRSKKSTRAKKSSKHAQT